MLCTPLPRALFFAVACGVAACKPDGVALVAELSMPPPPPASAAPGDASAPRAIAITKLFMGTTDRFGNPGATAWEFFGFDLDGVYSSSPATLNCQPNLGASPETVFIDGPGGIDNSFGRKLLPILTSVTSGDIEVEGNAGIQKGDWTLIFNLTGLGPGKNYAPVNASLLVGENRMGTTWNVRPEFLSGPTIDTASTRFPASYLTTWKNGDSLVTSWVSTDKATIPLHLNLAGIALDVSVHAAIIAMELDPTHTQASSGVIGGVLNTEDLVAELHVQAGIADPTLCNTRTLDLILDNVRRASDIMSDGTRDPTQTCNGISIGLGFEGEAVTIGDVGPKAPPPATSCSPPNP